MMGSRYPEEKPYSFYDPEQDWEGLRAGPPHHRSAPVSPRGPVSPRIVPPGIYPPELNHGHSRGVGRGVVPPPLYVNPNFDHFSIPQGALPNERYEPGAPPSSNYRRGVPLNDNYGRGAPPNVNYARGTPPNENYARGAPPSDGYGRGAPPSDGYGRGAPPSDGYGRGAPSSDGYGRGAPPSDGYGRGAPPSDGYGRGAPPSDGYGRGAPPRDGYGRGAPSNDSYARGIPPNDTFGRGAPPNQRYGRETSSNDSYARGIPPNDTFGRGAPPNQRYGRETSSNDIYEQGVPPNDTYGRGSLESGFAGRGLSGRAPGTPGNNYGSPTSGTRPPYGDESSGYARGFGRGQGVVPLGDGRYEYGGLHQPESLHMEEDYNRGASTPAPISSEYAHQVYASVFSDPVYGGARQLNSQAGYHEEPDLLQQEHHREDVQRHPNDF